MGEGTPRSEVLGRATELAELTALLEQARSGEPRTVLVDGPPGIGKSTLLRHFLAEVGDACVLDASGDEPERTTPYGVVEQLLRASPLAPHALREAIARSPLADPPTVGAAMVDLLGKLGETEPVVLVLDDLHWADTASLQALAYVLRRLRGECVLAVMAVRTELLDRVPHGMVDVAQGPRGTRRSLEGLTVDDLTTLADGYGHGARSAAVAHRLHRHTSGNPLHARAVLDELSGEELTAGGEDTPLPAPRSFTALIHERFAACGEDTRRLVAAVAVLGPSAGLVVAGRLAGIAAPLDAVQDAIDARLLVARRSDGGTVVAFPHALVRAAVYHDLGPVHTSSLHRRAAQLVDEEAVSLRHLVDATETDAELAERCARFAAREAVRGAWAPAAAALLQAARTSADRPTRERHLLDAVNCSLLAGDAATLADLAPRVDGCADGARRRYVLGQLALVAGDWPKGSRLLELAWEADDRDADPQLAGRIASAMVNLCVNVGRGPESVMWAGRALQLRGPHADLGGEVTSMLLVGLALCGRTHEGLGIADRFLRDPDRTAVERVGAQMGRGVLHLWSGDTPAAADVLADAYAGWRVSGPFQTGHIALFYLADAEYRLGRWDEAIAHAEAAVTATSAAQQVWFAALVHAVAAFPLAGRGRFDQADQHVQRAVEAAAAIGHAGAYVWSATAAARLAHARDDHRGVLAIVDRLVGQLREVGLEDIRNPCIQPWTLLRAEALARTGDLAGAGEVLDELEPGETRAPVLLEVGRLRGLVADLARRRDEAEAAFRLGLDHVDGASSPLSHALLLLDHGSFLRRAGQRRSARTQLTTAGEILRGLGAEPYLARCDQQLRTSGGPGRRDDDPLTPQERAVVELVATGATNREVAGQLHVTVKAVEYHLSNVYRKLGLRSRAELAALVAAADPPV